MPRAPVPEYSSASVPVDGARAATPAGQSLDKAVRAAGFTVDPALSRVAEDLAASIPSRNELPPALVDVLMWSAGLTDPPPSIIVIELDSVVCTKDAPPSEGCQQAIQSMGSELSSTVKKTASSRVGAGVGFLPDGKSRLIIAHLNRSFEIEKLPVSMSLGTQTSIRGTLLGGRGEVRVEVIDPVGTARALKSKLGAGGRLEIPFACVSPKGAHKVEILATGSHGPEVVANFPVYCGAEPPRVLSYETESLDPNITIDEVAQANFDYLNAERKSKGLPPLIWDDKISAIARGHSNDMVRSGFVGHVSPTTGDVAQRFRTAKIESVVTRENVARGYGPKGIHESLMNSPGHRVNLLAPDVTHVGIGVAFGEVEGTGSAQSRPILLTQNFYKPVGFGIPRDLPGSVRNDVDAMRKREGLAPLRWDDRLSAIAQRRAADARVKIDDEAFAIGFQTVEHHIVSSNDHSALSGIDVLRGRGDTRSWGIGVVARDDGRSFVMVIVIAAM